ncbi:hypothetical protein M9H77_07947 [Catharanthus roseus]|uniref:Uncharacterized protein n=1 Tax=Catharanthus roseus TaxID=4058 RepID=A0ACC0BWL5_CATRO|nr:hypothetical protein M9H77_07947 [Catharanthus roseus]
MSSAASPPHFFFFVPIPHALRALLALCSPLILSLDGSDGLRRSFPTKIERAVSHRDVDSFSAPNEMGNLEPPIYTFFWALHLYESKPGPKVAIPIGQRAEGGEGPAISYHGAYPTADDRARPTICDMSLLPMPFVPQHLLVTVGQPISRGRFQLEQF